MIGNMDRRDFSSINDFLMEKVRQDIEDNADQQYICEDVDNVIDLDKWFSSGDIEYV